MDVLTDILASLRLTGGVVIDAQTRGDFCLLSRFKDEDSERFQVRADELVAYHYIRSGRLYASVDGEPPITLNPGDIVLLPRNDVHLLYTRPGLTPIDSHEVIEAAPNGPARVLIDNGGTQSIFTAAFWAFRRRTIRCSTACPRCSSWIRATMRIRTGSKHPCACSTRRGSRRRWWPESPSFSSPRPSGDTWTGCQGASAAGWLASRIRPSRRRWPLFTAATPRNSTLRLSRARPAYPGPSWASCSPN
ncbi:cupin domain-containing protein [Sphingomonas daechungensis]|uniref:Cupin domain-containing protein n=1 Tax=Sphingomonas daechungensis TaxID=1176646 RepID=A0ABX6T0I2_9SPHN|nr:cupin domain-containing protein [Sphingomonas daechungensis]